MVCCSTNRQEDLELQPLKESSQHKKINSLPSSIGIIGGLGGLLAGFTTGFY